MSRMSRRSFFRALRGRSATRDEAPARRAPAPPPGRGFSLAGFYEQREFLGLVGEPPPPIRVTADPEPETATLGCPDVKRT